MSRQLDLPAHLGSQHAVLLLPVAGNPACAKCVIIIGEMDERESRAMTLAGLGIALVCSCSADWTVPKQTSNGGADSSIGGGKGGSGVGAGSFPGGGCTGAATSGGTNAGGTNAGGTQLAGAPNTGGTQ